MDHGVGLSMRGVRFCVLLVGSADTVGRVGWIHTFIEKAAVRLLCDSAVRETDTDTDIRDYFTLLFLVLPRSHSHSHSRSRSR